MSQFKVHDYVETTPECARYSPIGYFSGVVTQVDGDMVHVLRDDGVAGTGHVNAIGKQRSYTVQVSFIQSRPLVVGDRVRSRPDAIMMKGHYVGVITGVVDGKLRVEREDGITGLDGQGWTCRPQILLLDRSSPSTGTTVSAVAEKHRAGLTPESPAAVWAVHKGFCGENF